MKIAGGSKLVFIGDSITDAGRGQPAGEGLGDALGRGYVAQVDALLGAAHPELGIRVVNQGNSGNTVRDLEARWQTAVVDRSPQWLSIMIGINDVWRQFDSPRQTEGHVYLEEYEKTLEELVSTSRAALQGLVMMSPFYIEPNPGDAMRAQMDRYGQAVRRVAGTHDAIFVDTQAAFDRVLQHSYPAALAWDRVHPGQTGHMVIARAFLDAVDFAW
ncbi:MAG: SGNH/GDSL hydrolase family protein [Chloroflexi bacterium]|nr:SGNH/GDSL hydrolase family protein [Chloroflexota bacterium]